jgi:MinD superfamily P-loop ATPase
VRIAVASGKGGTGKTLVSTSLAWHWSREGRRVTYLDADVEEPNGHLLLHPEVARRERFGVPVPVLRGETCSGCGECQRFCAYNAIIALPDRVMLFPELCHSCGGCLLACPDDELIEVPRETGSLAFGDTPGESSVAFASGTLDVGEAMATPLISGLVRSAPTEGIVVVDAPPGTSCSAMEAVGEADMLLLVTEPTPFGLHDLKLAVEMGRDLDRPLTALLNRSDLGDDRVRRYLDEEWIPVLAEIPFLEDVARAYSRGEIAAEMSPLFGEFIAGVAGKLALWESS